MARKGRIALGMSGGVDSAVSAALLMRDGWDVVGVTCLFTDTPASHEAAHDASQVAHRLGIDHIRIDACDLFEEHVAHPFACEYASGLTPSPCVGCNAHAKVPSLIRAANKMGCDAWATGHYAHVVRVRCDGTVEENDAAEPIGEADRFAIRAATQTAKDQSYMLAQLSQGQLAKLVLPLGDLSKQKVREIAAELDLPVAHKPESQDICFAPEGYRAFLLERGIEDAPGKIVNADGDVLGTHTGLSDYTIGQRKGIGVAAREPYYVIGKDLARNELIVGFADAAKTTGVIIGDIVWQAIPSLGQKRSASVKLRYRSRAATCIMEPAENGTARLVLSEPQTLTAPGQYAVLYDSDIVLGSGKILEVERA
ncbi:MAG: tRNA 2-thiouridine(34) synthase MnmA [Eggerthellaceae bacterium]|nr:tRNA 2-thiouridine(34) synthase MnmA [Eggerthellaceae bacterium]